MITLRINGEERQFDGDGDMPLLWFLRDELALTGTKYGCGKGLCGSCTVHLNGEAVRSCVVTVSAAADLVIGKFCPSPLQAGDPITYTIDLTNNGPSYAENVVVFDTLPFGVTFVSTTGCLESPGGEVPPGSGNIQCTIGTMPNSFVPTLITIDATLDPTAMREALDRLRGRRDWSAFTGSPCEIADRVRHLTEASFDRRGADEAWFSFSADGFLTYMVRNLVGTLVEIARGRFDARRLDRILEAGDRRLAGPTAPARGAVLWRVHYGDGAPGGGGSGDAVL